MCSKEKHYTIKNVPKDKHMSVYSSIITVFLSKSHVPKAPAGILLHATYMLLV